MGGERRLDMTGRASARARRMRFWVGRDWCKQTAPRPNANAHVTRRRSQQDKAGRCAKSGLLLSTKSLFCGEKAVCFIARTEFKSRTSEQRRRARKHYQTTEAEVDCAQEQGGQSAR
eukprot:1661402-Pleurochrysis_carterae.AAC.1